MGLTVFFSTESLKLFMRHQLATILGYPSLTSASRTCLHGLDSKLSFTSSCALVPHVNRQNQTGASTQACLNHLKYLLWLGRASPWILSKDYHLLVNCVLVVVDQFSKYSHFIPLSHPFTALTVAKSSLHNVYRLHGLPTSIVSDRDRVFTSRFWQELFRLTGVTLKMSSTYHPQTDGQTERVNQCVETFLHCFVSASPAKWVDWIYLAEYCYNTSWHSSLGHSLFFVLYGHHPRHFGISDSAAVQSVSLEEWLNEKSMMTTLIQQHLTRAQKQMKAQADKSRSKNVCW